MGTAFSYKIAARNGPTSYGATGLPARLSISKSTGTISGTPTAAGQTNAILSATNGAGTATQNLALTIILPAPVISSTTTASGTAGTAFGYTIAARNSPTSFTAAGLPSGLSVNTSTDIIAGTPTISGTFNVALGATNAGGTGTVPLTLTVNPGMVSFNSWESRYFNSMQLGNPSVSGPAATPQGDGVFNLLKYLCDIDPSRPMTDADRAALPQQGTTVDGQYMTLTYRQNINVSGVTVTFQNSTDLTLWAAVANATPTMVGTDAATGSPIMRVTVPITAPRQFIRLQVAMGS